MSYKLSSLKVKISANGAQAVKELKTVEKKVQDVAKRMKSIGSAMSKYVTGPLAALAAVSVKTANTQLQAEAKLRNALKGREGVQKRLIAQAAELQGRSLFGDEEIIAQQAVLAAMGRTEQQINDIIEASAQLSAATEMSLDSAVKNLAKTYGGLAGELGESIPALRELTKEQLQNGDAVKLIKEQYQGFAESTAQAGTGSLVQLKNQLGDLSEQIGMILLPFFKSLVNALSKLVGWLQNLSPAAQKTIVVIAGIAAVVGPLIISLGLMAQGWAAIVAMAPSISAAFTSMSGPIGAIITLVSTLVVMLSNALTLRDRLQREQQQNRTADEAERRSIIVSNTRKEAATLTDKQLEQAIADTIKEWADLKKAIGDAPSRYQADALNALHWRREVLSEELALRKMIAQNLKVSGGYGGGVGGTNDEIEEATGLIGQLQKSIKELEATLPFLQTVEEIAQANEQLAEMRKRLERLQGLTPAYTFGPVAAAADLSALTTMPGMKFAVDEAGNPKLDESWKRLEEFRKHLEELKKEAIKANQEISSVISSTAYNLATGIGEMLGNAMSGEEGAWAEGGRNILRILGQSIKELGAALIKYAVIVEGFKKAIKDIFKGPAGIAAAIALGIGAIAAGQALINKASQPPKLAKGGLAYGPTLAVVGDNPGATSDPEVIAPLSKLRSYMGGQRLQLTGDVSFELSGDKLRATLNRENVRLATLG